MCKKNGKYYDVQVKSIRSDRTNYIFFPKDKFKLRHNLLAAIVLFNNLNAPQLFLIPSIDWQSPNNFLVSRDYVGKKSKREWGINFSKKNQLMLEEYSFKKTVDKL